MGVRTCWSFYHVGLVPSDDWGNSWTSQRISKVRKCESSGVLKKARGKGEVGKDVVGNPGSVVGEG